MADAKTMDDQAIQLMKGRLIQEMTSRAQQSFPSRRYIDSLDVNFIGTIDNKFMFWLKKLVYFVDLGTSRPEWFLRAVHNKRSAISNAESRDFIEKASGSYAIFKSNADDIKGYYLMQMAG